MKRKVLSPPSTCPKVPTTLFVGITAARYVCIPFFVVFSLVLFPSLCVVVFFCLLLGMGRVCVKPPLCAMLPHPCCPITTALFRAVACVQQVVLWDFMTGQELKVAEYHRMPITSVRFCADTTPVVLSVDTAGCVVCST